MGFAIDWVAGMLSSFGIEGENDEAQQEKDSCLHLVLAVGIPFMSSVACRKPGAEIKKPNHQRWLLRNHLRQCDSFHFEATLNTGFLPENLIPRHHPIG